VSDWTWIDVRVVAAIHDRQLAEHGGLVGVRDAGALDSALARPQNLAAYGDPDAPALAAAYAFGIARNHPFADGNKRTAWVLARLFLSANGLALQFDKLEAIRTVEALAAGQLSEDELGQWLRERVGRA
jgi:death-on-curing protein